MADSVNVYPELVVSLDLVRAGAYQVELRFNDPSNAAEVNPVKGETQILMGDLLSREPEPKKYGASLASMLFADSKVLTQFEAVKASVKDTPLRVRLQIGSSAPELHTLRWELLADPASGSYLFASDKVLLSRFMTSDNWRTVRLRAKADMTALVAVSSPSDAADYRLAKVNLDGEIATATDNLKGIDVLVAGKEQPLTLVNLSKKLQDPVDILYLVCHGAYKNESTLFLQKDDGTVDLVRGEDFADMLGLCPQQPRLVVLASCESAASEQTTPGDAGSESFHALAPMLAKAGVGAVVAMRGKISMETVKQVMPVFFRELLVDGQVDRAIAAARGAALVAQREDAWMMALYMRLRGGRIWYEPGFAQEVKWDVIVDQVQRKSIRGHHRLWCERILLRRFARPGRRAGAGIRLPYGAPSA
jgi:hypothetical protein